MGLPLASSSPEVTPPLARNRSRLCRIPLTGTPNERHISTRFHDRRRPRTPASYAEHGKTLLEWAGREMIADLPSDWDQTDFIDGLPASHVVVASRKGDTWYVAGMTAAPRTANVTLDFLDAGREYELLLFQDGTHTTMERETRRVNSASELSIEMLENGGFAARFAPVG